MPAIPRRSDIVEDYNGLDCRVFPSDKIIKVTLLGSSDNNYSDLFKILRKYDGYNITIQNIISVGDLNKLCSILGVCDFSGSVEINLCFKIGNNKFIKGLTNNTFINLEALPSYVRIKGFNNNNDQTDFTSWAHNLNAQDKITLTDCLTSQDRLIFQTQENVMGSLFNEIKRAYPDIMSYDEKRRFETAFWYVKNNFPYSSEVIGPDGLAKEYTDYSKDAVETYRRRRGVCSGRSNLLTLVANSPLLKCNCTSIGGHTAPSSVYPNGLPHCWNVFIDSDGKAYHYDLSFNNFYHKELNELEGRRIDAVYYSMVQEIINQYQTPPALPPRRKSYRPLPPRREQ